MSKIFALLVLLTVGALSSCSGADSNKDAAIPAAAAGERLSGQGGLGAPTGLPELPAPNAALEALRATSELKLSASGADFEVLLPSSFVTAQDAAASFDPQWLPQNEKSFGDLAFAMYRLNLAGHAGERMLRLISAAGKPDPSQVYVGLSDWDQQRWDFFRLGTSPFSLPKAFDLMGHENGSGDVLVVVVVLGDQPYVLGELTVAALDETEPNDTPETAQLLDFGSASGFRGDLGSGDVDYYLIPGSGTDYLQIEARHNNESRLKLSVFKTGGEQYGTRTTFSLGDGYVNFSDDEELLGTDFPLVLAVELVEGVSDYSLSISMGAYPSVGLLNADPPYGDLPFTTNFSTDAENEPGVIYRWDVDNDNRIDAITTEPNLTWTYTVDGLYTCELTARSPQGLEIYTEKAIIAGQGPYHEREDNDSDETANQLDDSLAESGWLGNAGYSFSGAYDSDSDDVVKFTIPAGQAIAFQLTDLENPQEETELFFFGTVFYPGILGRPQMLFNDDDEPDPETLRIRNNGSAADYKLTWAYGTPPRLTIESGNTAGGPAPFELNIVSSVEVFDGKTVEAPQWDIDGDYIADGEGLEFSHTFSEAGEYTVTGYVYDEDGLYGVQPVFVTVE